MLTPTAKQFGPAAIVRYPANHAMARHDHEETILSFVLMGAVSETVNGWRDDGGAGAVLIKPGGVAHANRWGPSGALMLSLRLTGALETYAEDLREDGWRWLKGRYAARTALAVAHNALIDDGAAIEENIMALTNKRADSRRVPRHRQLPWLHRVRDAIHATHGAVSVAKLAEAESLNPVYLTRRFRQEFGTTISAYARRLRIQEAAQRVGEDPVALTQLSHDMGFSDHSHLCRSFRSEFGIAPMAFRSLMRALAP